MHVDGGERGGILNKAMKCGDPGGLELPWVRGEEVRRRHRELGAGGALSPDRRRGTAQQRWCVYLCIWQSGVT